MKREIVEIAGYKDNISMAFYDKKKDKIIFVNKGLDEDNLSKLSFEMNEDRKQFLDIMLSDAYKTDNFKEDKGIRFIKAYKNELTRQQTKLDKLIKQYPNKEIVLAGHSRGGKMVIDLGEKYDLEYHAFQPAETQKYGNALLSGLASSLLPTAQFPGLIKDIFKTDKVFYDIEAGEIPAALTGTKRLMGNLALEYPNMQKTITSSIIGGEEDPKKIGRSIVNKIGMSSGLDRGMLFMKGINPTTEPLKLAEKFGGDAVDELTGSIKLPFLPKITGRVDLLNLLGGEKKDDKIIENPKSNIYRTKSDKVSSGFGLTGANIIDDKEYILKDQPTDMATRIKNYFVGTHSIDHFISKELYDAILLNEPIPQEELSIPQFASTFSGYKVADARSLCKQNPDFNPYCKFLV